MGWGGSKPTQQHTIRVFSLVGRPGRHSAHHFEGDLLMPVLFLFPGPANSAPGGAGPAPRWRAPLRLLG